MQVLNVEGFEKRILYNAAKAYSIQLPTGGEYTDLAPVIALTLTDFLMFPGHEAYLTRFALKEKDFLLDYPQDDLERESMRIWAGFFLQIGVEQQAALLIRV
jgi:predicted transposase/invertase (TIGR01784 family)